MDSLSVVVEEIVKGFREEINAARPIPNYCDRYSLKTFESDLAEISVEKKPIINVQLICGNQKAPPGFITIKALDGATTEFARGSHGKMLSICVERMPEKNSKASARPITAITIVHESKMEFIPLGFEVVFGILNGVRFSDISSDVSTKGTFICVCRGDGPPILDLRMIPASDTETPAIGGLDVVERTPLGYSPSISGRIANSTERKSSCLFAVQRGTSHLIALTESLPESASDDTKPSWDTNCAGSFFNRWNPSESKFSRSVLNLKGVPEKSIGSLIEIFLACYSYNISDIAIALQYFDILMKSGFPEFAPSHTYENGCLTLGDLMIKAAADSVELSMDILFGRAMRVMVSAMEISTRGLCPWSLHFFVKSMVQTKHFFDRISVQEYQQDRTSIYSSLADNRLSRESADSYDLKSSNSSLNQNAQADKRISGVHGSEQHIPHLSDIRKALRSSQNDSLSGLDLKFLIRCPGQLLEIIVKRAANAGVKNLPEDVVENVSVDLENTPDFMPNVIERSSVSTNSVDDVDNTGVALKVVMNHAEICFKRMYQFNVESLEFALEIQHKFCDHVDIQLTQQNAIMVLVWLSFSCVINVRDFHNGNKANLKPDSYNQLAALDLLKEFIALTSSVGRTRDANAFFSGYSFGYHVRRFAVQGILSCVTCPYYIERALLLITELWKNYRHHLKVEIGVLFEEVIIYVLNENSCLSQVRSDILESLLSWLADRPIDLIELYLNFENDPVVSEWRSFEGLMKGLYHLTDPSMYRYETDAENAVLNDKIQSEAIQVSMRLIKSLDSFSGNKKYAKALQASSECGAVPTQPGRADKETRLEPVRSSTSVKEISLVRERHNRRLFERKIFLQAFEISHKSGVKDALEILFKNNIIENNPLSIALFLRANTRNLDARQVGDYMGKKVGDKFMNEVRFQFTLALSFSGRSFEECLRLFLENGGFVMPGEAQKVEAFMEAFATCFVTENSDDYKPEDADVIMALSFSAVMLNTDLHNPAIHKRTKMTENQFLQQIKSIDKASRISEAFGRSLYRSVALREIKIAVRAPVKPLNAVPPSDGHITIAPSSGGLFPPPTAAKAQGGDSFTPEMGIERKLVAETPMAQNVTNAQFFSVLSTNVVSAQRLLATNAMTLMPFNHNVTVECVEMMFEICWVHFYKLVSNIYEWPMKYVPNDTAFAMDILFYSMKISLRLSMMVPLKAFAMLMAKFEYLYFHDGICGADANRKIPNIQHRTQREQKDKAAKNDISKGDHLKSMWYEEVMSAKTESEKISEAIKTVQNVISFLKGKVNERSNMEKLILLQNRFDEESDSIVIAGRRFIREGSLMKRMTNKRYRKYHFFLFSDLLLYSMRHHNGGCLRIHQMLPLQSLMVRDTAMRHCFELVHPRKTFVVQAANEQEKKSWMDDIRNLVTNLLNAQMGSDVKVEVLESDPNGSRSYESSCGSSVTSLSTMSSASALDQDQSRSKSSLGKGVLEFARSKFSVLNQSKHSAYSTEIPQNAGKPAVSGDFQKPLDGVSTLHHRAVSGNMRVATLSTSDIKPIGRASSMMSVSKSLLVHKPESGLTLNGGPPENSPSPEDKKKTEWLMSLHTKYIKESGEIDVTKFTDNDLDEGFLTALQFSKPILNNSHSHFKANDEEKLLLYSFYKQGTKGDNLGDSPPRSDWVAYSKDTVWRSLLGTDKAAAKCKFLNLLTRIAPGWKE